MKVAFLVLACTIASITGLETLKLVHVFFRHGSRTPDVKDVYPNDPHKLQAFLPMGYGQLTNEGIEMSYKLGKNLRRQYNAFLGDIYSADYVKAVSTDFDRTKMSVLAVLAGLFPPSESQTWHDRVRWLPIPYEYDKAQNDFVLRRTKNYCPSFVRELERVLDSVQGRNLIDENRETFQMISRNAGKPYRNLHDIFTIYQTLYSEQHMNLTLPEWTREIFPEKVEYLSAKQCEFENYNQLLRRLNGGRSLSMIIRNMRDKIASTSFHKRRKIYLYSGHENNVLNILAALNLFKPHIPTFSSATILELHYLPEKEDHAVRVLYAKNITTGPIPLTIDGCEEYCPFDDFIRITKPVIPVNYTAECEALEDLGDY